MLLAGAIVGFGSGFATVAWQTSAQAARSDSERQLSLLFDTAARVEREFGNLADAVEVYERILLELVADIEDGKIQNNWLFEEYAEFVERNRKLFDVKGEGLQRHTLQLQLYALGLSDEKPDFSSGEGTPADVAACAATVDRVLRKRMPV